LKPLDIGGSGRVNRFIDEKINCVNNKRTRVGVVQDNFVRQVVQSGIDPTQGTEACVRGRSGREEEEKENDK
jgi:hypothetical protein